MRLGKRFREAILWAVGGAVLGAASMAVPLFLKPGLRMPIAVAVIVVVGMAGLGALIGILNADSR